MILVDDRERHSGICEVLSARQVAFAIERLDRADYILSGCVFVERKTVGDFLDCLKTRRLFEQTAHLCQGRHRCVLIIEGAHLPGRPTVCGALCALAAKWRVPVLRSSTVMQTAWYLAHMDKQCAQQRPLREPYTPSVCLQHPSLTTAQRMLMQIDGIGPQLSAALLAHFGTLRAVFSAPQDALCAVPGVGKPLAQKILAVE